MDTDTILTRLWGWSLREPPSSNFIRSDKPDIDNSATNGSANQRILWENESPDASAQNVEKGNRDEIFPAEIHQLIYSQARQRPSQPHH